MATALKPLIEMGKPPIVFVSYSHFDEAWKDKLLPHLRQLQRVCDLEVWDDRRIKAGVDWYADIEEVLSRTKVAVCLISERFLDSSFCMDEEVAYLLQQRNKGKIEIISVMLEECTWKPHRWLKRLQRFPRDDETVKTNYRANSARVFKMVSDQVYEMLQPGCVFERPPPAGESPERVDIKRLPETSDLLFGRQKELNKLDRIWDRDEFNVAVFKASGGVGKSSLVRAWVEDMALDNYRGARRVFAWSFYSQGTKERVTSADEFISHALGWFGDETKGEGLSPWDRGQRLAELVQEKRTLLLLDGLEPLQSGQTFDRGKIKDPGLEVLLDELGRSNPGLCLISTREEVSDLWHDRQACRVDQFDLEIISKTAGRALLRVSGIEGEDAALEQAVEDFGRHAYAVKLLGNFLTWRETPDIEHAADIPERADIDEKDGRHPRRVMAAFAERFGDSAKADILAMLGLFDRPADAGCIASLRKEPTVPGLNAAVLPIGEAVWREQIAELRKLGLLTPESHHITDELDAHPLVREHFGAKLRAERENAWKAGHERLYEHLITVPEKHQPDTLAEMAPLFQAVHHGCQVGWRQEETFSIIYGDRINRGQRFYLYMHLGALSTDLGIVASFFETPFKQPSTDAPRNARPYLLNHAAVLLCKLGRLREAVTPTASALAMRIEERHWRGAATIASNFSTLQLTLGNIKSASESAEAAINNADRSPDTEWRVASRVTLATAIIDRGDYPKAEILFETAETMQKKNLPAFKYLYSLGGYSYCDLLLSQGQLDAVRQRAEQTLQWAMLVKIPRDIALNHLSLGKVALVSDDRTEAKIQLELAVDGLRVSGNIMHLPLALLARAAFFREVTKYRKSRRDLDEVIRLAKRCGMRLHKCDAHLEFARLEIKQGQPDAARVHVKSADALVTACGYHRRDKEVADLKEELGL